MKLPMQTKLQGWLGADCLDSLLQTHRCRSFTTHSDTVTDVSELGIEIIYLDLVQANCTYRQNITTLDPKTQEIIIPITCSLHGCKKKK